MLFLSNIFIIAHTQGVRTLSFNFSVHANQIQKINQAGQKLP